MVMPAISYVGVNVHMRWVSGHMHGCRHSPPYQSVTFVNWQVKEQPPLTATNGTAHLNGTARLNGTAQLNGTALPPQFTVLRGQTVLKQTLPPSLWPHNFIVMCAIVGGGLGFLNPLTLLFSIPAVYLGFWVSMHIPVSTVSDDFVTDMRTKFSTVIFASSTICPYYIPLKVSM